ncbi:NADH-quinone oxidoreductase subunit N [Campylobacter estrildidarum]|uniref:NADH-quinone oxidoreductase subunit N n=1 Tax=Campylobacter estrildidarum TaxID=2510189 RepID=A0A4U7BGL3_9BACT|nr:NADH-quinone oxidoreductase subunit N [Campylobacter estrildidarum]TKX30858.1 NADH-quinone oxidoreductase subunit N [Campylobacter estrildidarum]
MLDNIGNLNISLSYPFLFLIIVAIVLLLCSAFWKFHRTFYIATCSLSLVVSAFLILNNVDEQGLGLKKAFLGTLNNDIVSFYASLVILCFSFLYLLMQKDEDKGEFYSLFMFMVSSLLLMVSSSNLILIFIGLEASSLALYTLIAMRGTNNAVSSAIKYFSVAAVGSGFFVMASALIYMKTGTLDLDSKLALQKDPVLLSAGVMIFVLCAVKLSLAPFHFWLKDVYFAAYSNLAAFISVVPKIAMFVVVIRLFEFLNHLDFENIISLLAVFSMLAAAIAALSQKDAKKVFAYSSIVHSSFVLAACIPLLSVEENVLNPIFIYWIFFSFANYGVFLILSTFKSSSFDEFNALLVKKPLIALSLTFCVLSLAGIPPFGAFWGKVIVLKTLITANYWYLALFMALASVLMLYSYLKIVIHALFIKTEPKVCAQLNFIQSFILALCTLISIFALFLLFKI